MKLVQREPESDALRRFLRRHRDDDRVTSTLARVEVVRAVLGGGAKAVAKARGQLARLHEVNIDRGVLDTAATLAPGPTVRSLDAIHLASAQLVAGDLRSVVTYDRRMAAAAIALGLPVEAPGKRAGEESARR